VLLVDKRTVHHSRLRRLGYQKGSNVMVSGTATALLGGIA